VSAEKRRARRRAGSGLRRGGESGAAAVEFALLAPVLFALLFGAYELGWALYCGATVRFAIERASRALISNPSTTAAEIKSAAQTRLSGLPINSLAVTTDQESAAGAQIVRVSWQYAYTMALPFVPDTTFHFDSSTVVPLPAPLS
jgi:Flp pilus assembly protein TadG